MKWKECREMIISDLKRLNHIKFGMIRYLITNASFKITFWFRIGSYLQSKKSIWYFPLFILVAIIYKHYQYLTGIQLPLGAPIKGGLTFAHYSCIIINGTVPIGENCTVYQGVTIGSVRGGETNYRRQRSYSSRS